MLDTIYAPPTRLPWRRRILRPGPWARLFFAGAALGLIGAIIAWIVTLVFILSCPQFGKATENQCYRGNEQVAGMVAVYALYFAIACAAAAVLVGIIAFTLWLTRMVRR